MAGCNNTNLVALPVLIINADHLCLHAEKIY